MWHYHEPRREEATNLLIQNEFLCPSNMLEGLGFIWAKRNEAGFLVLGQNGEAKEGGSEESGESESGTGKS
jgi:hypothetical protein